VRISVHLWSYLTQFFLEWEMFQTKGVDKIKTCILCSITFFKNSTIYEIMWKNIVELDRPQMTVWHMRFAYRITKTTNTYWEYVILIVLPLQQWLHESASMLCYTYIAYLVKFLNRHIYLGQGDKHNHDKGRERASTEKKWLWKQFYDKGKQALGN